MTLTEQEGNDLIQTGYLLRASVFFNVYYFTNCNKLRRNEISN
jgi:hypothetical protein